jgi:hypothetical protein
MRRLLIVCGTLLVIGCGPSAIVPAKPGAPVAHEHTRAIPWQTNLMPTEGITVEMPGVGEDRTTRTELGRDRLMFYHRLSLASTSPQISYEAGVYSLVDKGNRSTIADLLDEVRATVHKIESQKKASIPGFDGVAIVGTTESGQKVLLNAYLVGAYIYTLRVESSSQEKAEKEAERFFASFRLDMPFRFFVSANDYYMIAKPMPARFVTTHNKLENAGNLVMTTYLFLYDENDGFSMSALPTDNDTSDPDVAEEMLDGAARGLAIKEGTVIERMTSTIVDGAPGRDISIKAGKEGSQTFTRALIVVANRRLYIATRTAMQKAKLQDADAAKFFGSLTIGRAP